MKRVVVDTNVVVSFLTDRNALQQELAAELFQRGGSGELELILHQTVVTETVYVLGNLYELSSSRIAPVLRDLLAMPGVRSVDRVPWQKVLDLWPDPMRDFADAMLAAATRELRFDSVATFDQRFQRALHREGLALHWPMD